MCTAIQPVASEMYEGNSQSRKRKTNTQERESEKNVLRHNTSHS